MFLAIIGLSMMFDLSAQKKVLTMEEAVVGYHLYPRSKYIQWQGDKNQLTYLDREGLMGESVDKEMCIRDRFFHLSVLDYKYSENLSESRFIQSLREWY